MNLKTSLLARTLLGLIVATVLLALIFIRTNVSAIFDALGDVRLIYLPPAMALLALSVWFQALRWRYLLRPLVDVPTRRLYPVVFVGHLGNSLVPLRAGELFRALILKRREGVSRMTALSTLIVERAFDGLALTALLIVFAATVHSSDRLWQLSAAAGLLFGLGTTVLILAAINEERASSIAGAVINHLPARSRAPLRRWVRSFLTGTAALRTLSGLSAVLLTTAAFWFTIGLVYAIVGEAFNLHEGFDTYLLVTAAANLSVSIPSSQGGLGPFEFFVRETLVFSGVAAPLATAYALVLHATILLTMIVAGIISLRVIGISLDLLAKPQDAVDADDGTTTSTSPPAETSAYRRLGEEASPPDRA